MNCQTVLQGECTNWTFPPIVYENFSFPTSLTTLVIVCTFSVSHSKGVKWPCGSDLYVPNDWWCEHFSCAYCPYVNQKIHICVSIFLEKCLFSLFTSFVRVHGFKKSTSGEMDTDNTWLSNGKLQSRQPTPNLGWTLKLLLWNAWIGFV